MRKSLTAWIGSRALPWRLVLAGAFTALVFGLVLYDLWLMVSRSVIADSDGVWLISVAHDLFVGAPMSGWSLPKITLYFPDLLSVVLLRLAGLHVGTTMVVYGVTSWVLVGVGILCGTRLRGGGWVEAVRAAIVGLLICIVAYADGGITGSFQNPFTHGGAALGALLGLVFLGHGLKRGIAARGACIGAACVAVLVASDRVILPQFVLPLGLTATVFLLWGWAPKARLLWTLGMLGVGSATGALITVAVQWRTGLTLAQLPTKPVGPGLRLAFGRFVADVGYAFNRWPLTFAIGLLAAAFVVLVVVEKANARFRWRSRTALDPDELAEWWLALGGTAICGATLAAVVGTQMWDGWANHRHILPVFIVPPALAVILWIPRLRGLPAGFIRALEVGLVLIATILVKQHARASQPYSSTLYAPQYACLDRYAGEEGLTAGYAAYWKSRVAMVLSQRDLTVVEVTWRMAPRRWANNAYWYSRGYWGRDRPPEYEFIITSQLDEAWLRARFGAPRAEQTCFGLEVWVYDRAEDLEFRNYLRSSIARETGDHDGWWDTATVERVPVLPVAVQGGGSVEIPVPRVPANVIEVVSPTRRAVNLTYRRAGRDVARQTVDFKRDARRILALPASLGADGFDAVFVTGMTREKHEIKEIVLMSDPKAESARR